MDMFVLAVVAVNSSRKINYVVKPFYSGHHPDLKIVSVIEVSAT